MREIKFRAWDKKNHIMLDLTWGNVASDGGLNTLLRDIRKVEKLMQFTGLKDKNGVEIYEGDIIDAPLHCGVASVVYGEPFGSAFCVHNHTLGTIDDSDMEVIGNIYENPELLN